MSLRLSFDEITYIMKLRHRSEVAEGTMAFYFEKPKETRINTMDACVLFSIYVRFPSWASRVRYDLQ